MDAKTLKILNGIMIAGLVFGVTVSSSIVANAIYTKSKLGVDKKPLVIASVIGIGLAYAISHKLIK